VVSCGDLFSEYLAYISDALNAPLCCVFGNHQGPLLYDEDRAKKITQGINIDQHCLMDETGLIIAGIQGSLHYNYGHFQYSELQMWLKVLGLVPALLSNKIKDAYVIEIDVPVDLTSDLKLGDLVLKREQAIFLKETHLVDFET